MHVAMLTFGSTSKWCDSEKVGQRKDKLAVLPALIATEKDDFANRKFSRSLGWMDTSRIFGVLVSTASHAYPNSEFLC